MERLIVSTAILALLAMSCAKNELADNSDVVPAGNFVSIPVRMESDADSKTSIDLTDGSVSWEAGDRIGFSWRLDDTFSSCESAALSAESISGGCATFSAAVPEDFFSDESAYASRNLYAVYPSSTVLNYSSEAGLSVTVPASQDGTFAGAGIALAKWDGSLETSPLKFKNLCGLFRFEITDANVRKVVFSSSSVIAGKAEVEFVDGIPQAKATDEAVKEITISVDGAGEYYIAVLPSKLSDVYIALYDGSDMLLGDKMTGNSQEIARRQIRNLGTIASTVGSRYFVTPSGAGLKDGSTWENAADIPALSTTLAATNGALKVYMAKGTYTVATEINPGKTNTSAAVEIYGGYPDNLSGVSIAGRDIVSNATTLDGAGSARLLILRRGTWRIDGVNFENAKTTSGTGSALIIEGDDNASFLINNCNFTGNRNEKSTTDGTNGGGAVRVSMSSGATDTSVKLTNCTFSNNSCLDSGGALYHTSGTLEMDHCIFTSNTATRFGGALVANSNMTMTDCDFDSNVATVSGGAIYSIGTSFVKMNRCTFRSNECLGEDSSTDGGGAIFVAKSSSGKVYMNRCFLANNNAKVNAFAIYTAKTSAPYAWLGMNNCVVRGPWSVNVTQGSVLQIKGHTVIVNSTLYSSTREWGTVSLGSKDEDGCTIVNDIVVNSSTKECSFYSSSYYMKLYNTIYSKMTNTKTPAYITDPNSSCLADASLRTGGNFPTSAIEWSTNRNGTKFYLDGDRYMYCYEWEGTTDAGTLQKPTLASVKSLISGTAASSGMGADFLSWLESAELYENGTEALAHDVRGVARNTAAMWPGAYEK